MARRLLRTKALRRLLLGVTLVSLLVVVVLRGDALYGPSVGGSGTIDFMQYWVAARLLLGGSNPYDVASVLAMERTVGWPKPDPVRMWNPPWTLPLVLPLAKLPFGIAALIWLLVQLGLVLASGFVLWRYYAPQDRRHWVGPLLAAAFLPTETALWWGQIGPWMLAGVVGFLWAVRAKRDTVAGASLALLMVKPQVAYLFWIAALYWSWRTRRWRIIAGWVVVLAASSGVVLVFAPSVFVSYLSAFATPPLHWAVPTIGFWLRAAAGLENEWLQFLPFLIGGVGLVIWLLRRRGPWRWPDLASPLLLASVFLAPHAWSYDHVVLLPAVVASVGYARAEPFNRRVVFLAALTASQLVLLFQNIWQGGGDAYSVWHVPVLAGLYWWAARLKQAGGSRCSWAGQST